MNDTLNSSLDPPSLAEAVTSKGFTRAALAPADDSELVARAKTLKISGSIGVATAEIFTRDETSERLCAACTATMRSIDLPAEFQ